VGPVPDPLLFLVVPGIEPGPPDLYPRTLTTRPQTRSKQSDTRYKIIVRFCHMRPGSSAIISVLAMVITCKFITGLNHKTKQMP
jgi:hypothetical protein